MMKGKDEECWCRWEIKHGICMVILAILVWLNGMYSWIGWDKFAAIVIAVAGLKLLIKGCCCRCRK
jgi:hypothetical protein